MQKDVLKRYFSEVEIDTILSHRCQTDGCISHKTSIVEVMEWLFPIKLGLWSSHVF